MALLSVSNDAKTIKGEKQGYLTGVMYLAPSTLSGRNLCPFASPGCIATCLNTAGRGVMTTVQRGRIKRSHAFRDDRAAFMRQLVREIASLVRKANRLGMTPLVRLNGTSDIPWENVYLDKGQLGQGGNIFAQFPNVQFYDYTKNPARMKAFLAGKLPANYHLTFSRSECNDADAFEILRLGGNVAVVFSTKAKTSTRPAEALPGSYGRAMYRIIDGDESDVRPADKPQGAASLDVRGMVIGLRAKGKARKDTSGFVVRVN